MKKITLLVILSLFITEIMYGQFIKPKKIAVKFDFGVIIEMADIIASKTTSFLNTSEKKNKVETAAVFTPITVYLSPKLYFSDYLGLEFRPGFFWGGEAFTGFEYGFYVRYKIIKNKLLLISGINFHSNMGTAHNSGFSTDEVITEYGFTLGYEAYKSITLLISYYHPSSQIKFYGETDNFTKYESYKLKGIIKLGFEFSF